MLRLAPRKASAGSACEANHAGAVPKSTPVTRDKRKGKTRTGSEGAASMGTNLRAVEGECDEDLYAEIGDDEAGKAAEDRENEAFRERLANEPFA